MDPYIKSSGVYGIVDGKETDMFYEATDIQFLKWICNLGLPTLDEKPEIPLSLEEKYDMITELERRGGSVAKLLEKWEYFQSDIGV